jgi:hypothetical protein
LIGINRINNRGVGALPLPPAATDLPAEQYVDINGDDQLTPSDILTAINFLDSSAAAGPAPEGEAIVPAASFALVASPAAGGALVPQSQPSVAPGIVVATGPGSLASHLADQVPAVTTPPLAASPSTVDVAHRSVVDHAAEQLDAGHAGEARDPSLEAVLDELAPDVTQQWLARP